MIWNLKYRNTLFERGPFSLFHCGEDTAVCVTKRESSETEAVERDDTEELIHNITLTATNIHSPCHQLPCLTHISATLALDLAIFRPF